MSEKIKHFLPLACAITLTCGLVYALLQQSYRQGANDPQIQISQDVAGNLEKGLDPKQVVPPAAIDISKSLAIFGIVYDDFGNVIASSAQLDFKTPELPKGVLEYARSHTQSRITWQPKPGVRSAIVVTRYGGDKPGFILIGRSLSEVEKRVDLLGKHAIMGWGVIMLATLASKLVFAEKKRRK